MSTQRYHQRKQNRTGCRAECKPTFKSRKSAETQTDFCQNITAKSEKQRHRRDDWAVDLFHKISSHPRRELIDDAFFVDNHLGHACIVQGC